MDDLKTEQRKAVQKEIMSLSTAILAGSVIVGVAVLLGANIIVNKLGGGLTNSAAVIGAAQVKETGPVEVTARKEAPSEGNGEVIVEEFSDFQCPFCQSFWNGTYKQIKTNYIDTGKITFIYRHYPLPFHQNAQKAAEASECANSQGKFWEYHDLLFANSKSDGKGLEVADLKKYAADLELNTSKFNSCLDDGDMVAAVQSDFTAGQSAGITGTPTFFINGKMIVGALPYAEFQKEIETALTE